MRTGKDQIEAVSLREYQGGCFGLHGLMEAQQVWVDHFRWMIALVSMSELPGSRICPEVHIHPVESYSSVQDPPCTPFLQQGLPIFLVLISCLITFLSLYYITRILVTGGQVVHMSTNTEPINLENLLERNKTLSCNRNVMLCECCPSEFATHLDLRHSRRKEDGYFISRLLWFVWCQTVPFCPWVTTWVLQQTHNNV